MQMLADEFTRAGHQVTVVTASENSARDEFPYTVLRRPGFWRLFQTQCRADVVVLGNISLWWVLMLLVCPRPWIATHHGWYVDTGRPVRWLDRLKMALAAFATANVSVSHAVNRFLGNPGVVIPNPYDKDTFHLMPEVPRDRDLVFLGRLVSDKGADVLIDALGILAQQKGLRPRLTVVGSGPEQRALEEQTARLGLKDQVTFAGPKRGRELAELLNAHRVMVIPSRWNEPFGIVALEGIACGCVIVCSAGGGLPEAAGECGIAFPNEDRQALAAATERVLHDHALQDRLRSAREEHLSRHQKPKIAEMYLSVIDRVAGLPSAHVPAR